MIQVLLPAGSRRPLQRNRLTFTQAAVLLSQGFELLEVERFEAEHGVLRILGHPQQRFCVFWIRKVRMVVEVLTINCQVSLKSNNGPVSAQELRFAVSGSLLARIACDSLSLWLFVTSINGNQFASMYKHGSETGKRSLMEFIEKLSSLSAKVRLQGATIQTEEATKNAFVMPFISTVLGYDVFDPSEVIPEFVCDVGTKKGEKIDYAIMKDGEVQILIECKKIGEPLHINHASQLFRYFHVTSARISILTNGQVYKFFTDLDAPNKMDEKPFLELDLLDIDEYSVPELTKLTKSAFDVDSIINAAGELKYVSQIKKVIAAQVSKPDDDFVKVFASRVYDGVITQKVREQFQELTRKAVVQFLNDQINDRLKSAMSGAIQPSLLTLPSAGSSAEVTDDRDESDDKVLTTLEELEGYHIVRAVVRSVVDAKRIVQRDTQSYFGILLDDNNRKPICRLHFNRSQKYIGIFDEEKNETRHPINSVDDIYEYSDRLKKTVGYYE